MIVFRVNSGKATGGRQKWQATALGY